MIRFTRASRTLLAGLAFTALASSASAVTLVSEQTLKVQRDQTTLRKLKNGIPVVVRAMPDSDLIQVNVSFDGGLKDLPPGKKVLNEWFWATLPMAAKDFPKEKVHALVEEYGINLGCGGAIEVAQCSLGALNDYWDKALPLFSGLLRAPSFAAGDAALTKDRLTASLKGQASDPGAYVNEIVNTVFYPKGHPYRLNHDEALAELDKLKPADLAAFHNEVLNAARMAIVVVTSLPADKVVADLDKAFGDLPTAPVTAVTPPPPAFVAKDAYKFFDRELPTAFIRVKFNTPGIVDKDAVAVRLLFEIVSEELGEEIRTKRSLSYAVHAVSLQYSLGIGVLSASTSKPKETLEAMNDVIQKIKAKAYSAEELEEYKTVFATSYYLSQETHESLAGVLATAFHFYGDANEAYEFPRKLGLVTSADIQRLAGQLLKDFRVGVIFGRKEFQDSWAKDFIAKNTGK